MDIWKHGVYVDTWSIVHILSGFLLAGSCFYFGLPFATALSISIVLLLLWEVFEWVLKIIEPSINVLVDIFVGLVGFFIGAYAYYEVGVTFNMTFYPVVVVAISLASWGFLDFLKRGYR